MECWILEKVHKLPEPIPCSGQRGLWDYRDGIHITVHGCDYGFT
jgi:hypothetical protein